MRLLFIFFITASVMLSCNVAEKKEATAEKNYETVKVSLEETEKKYPKKFIGVVGEKKKNLIGQTVVKGEIQNNAKMVSYKDVLLRIRFYSKTGAVLQEELETVYETVAPGNSVKFKTKIFTPKGTDSVSIKVDDAKF